MRTSILMLPIFFTMTTQSFGGWEEWLTFFPVKYPQGYYEQTKSDYVTIEDVYFKTPDGFQLHGWIARPKNTKTSQWLLWFPGNGGNVTFRLEWMEKLSTIPINVFIIDYRGYGKSEGNPTEQGIYKDAETAYRYLTEKMKIESKQIVILGESLGGAVAIDLAAKFPCGGLIIQSSFTNAKDMAKIIMPLIPLWLLIRSDYDNVRKIQNVRIPKLFIHSPSDEIVPYRLGKKLFESAPPPKQFYLVPNAGHNDTYIVGGQQYLHTLRQFMSALRSDSKL